MHENYRIYYLKSIKRYQKVFTIIVKYLFLNVYYYLIFLIIECYDSSNWIALDI